MSFSDGVGPRFPQGTPGFNRSVAGGKRRPNPQQVGNDLEAGQVPVPKRNASDDKKQPDVPVSAARGSNLVQPAPVMADHDDNDDELVAKAATAAAAAAAAAFRASQQQSQQLSSGLPQDSNRVQKPVPLDLDYDHYLSTIAGGGDHDDRVSGGDRGSYSPLTTVVTSAAPGDLHVSDGLSASAAAGNSGNVSVGRSISPSSLLGDDEAGLSDLEDDDDALLGEDEEGWWDGDLPGQVAPPLASASAHASANTSASANANTDTGAVAQASTTAHASANTPAGSRTSTAPDVSAGVPGGKPPGVDVSAMAAGAVLSSVAGAVSSSAIADVGAGGLPTEALTAEDLGHLRLLTDRFSGSAEVGRRALQGLIRSNQLPAIAAAVAKFEQQPLTPELLDSIYSPANKPRRARESRIYTQLGLCLKNLQRQVHVEQALHPETYNREAISANDAKLIAFLDSCTPANGITATNRGEKITQCMEICVAEYKKSGNIPPFFRDFVDCLKENPQSTVVTTVSRATPTRNTNQKGDPYLANTGLHEFLRVSNRVDAFLLSIGDHPGREQTDSKNIAVESNGAFPPLSFYDVYEGLRVDTASLMFCDLTHDGSKRISAGQNYIRLTGGGHPGAAYMKRSLAEVEARLDDVEDKGRDSVAYSVGNTEGSDAFHRDLKAAFDQADTPSQLVKDIRRIFVMHCYDGRQIPKRIKDARIVHVSGFRLHRTKAERTDFAAEMATLYNQSLTTIDTFMLIHGIQKGDGVFDASVMLGDAEDDRSRGSSQHSAPSTPHTPSSGDGSDGEYLRDIDREGLDGKKTKKAAQQSDGAGNTGAPGDVDDAGDD